MRIYKYRILAKQDFMGIRDASAKFEVIPENLFGRIGVRDNEFVENQILRIKQTDNGLT